MHTPIPTPIELDKPRAIAFTQRAQYRMGSLERPAALGDLRNPKKSYAALCAWLWACLTPAHVADFPGPEDVAEHVNNENVVRLMEALATAAKASNPPEKNGHGSTPGRSR